MSAADQLRDYKDQLLKTNTWFGVDQSRRAQVVRVSEPEDSTSSSGSGLRRVVFHFLVMPRDANGEGVLDEASLIRLNDDLSTVAVMWIQGRIDAAGVSTTMTSHLRDQARVGDTVQLECTLTGYSGAFLYSSTRSSSPPSSLDQPSSLEH
ncbi:hypothetical protein BJ085DRAFT_34331 [Dimargaris cristalligena]|uniref:Uncharacterized protein n=1 Tax=Dimargaris cristalligena TaxID=215637 RepID=A0A4P9ZU08_9FUNG|nr:hypothetical protein BJ085DRAFT_34331 [Dimargaris cristalligena]|eukprot:RKP36060.1 hypothetical protein BJ085DRAFT_34331 [Dimargaris cristalligena]